MKLLENIIALVSFISNKAIGLANRAGNKIDPRMGSENNANGGKHDESFERKDVESTSNNSRANKYKVENSEDEQENKNATKWQDLDFDEEIHSEFLKFQNFVKNKQYITNKECEQIKEINKLFEKLIKRYDATKIKFINKMLVFPTVINISEKISKLTENSKQDMLNGKEIDLVYNQQINNTGILLEATLNKWGGSFNDCTNKSYENPDIANTYTTRTNNNPEKTQQPKHFKNKVKPLNENTESTVSDLNTHTNKKKQDGGTDINLFGTTKPQHQHLAYIHPLNTSENGNNGNNIKSFNDGYKGQDNPFCVR